MLHVLHVRRQGIGARAIAETETALKDVARCGPEENERMAVARRHADPSEWREVM